MNKRSFALCARVAVVAATAVGVSPALEAGSIFMKNGYIIQGNIVDRDEDALILGWPNGKVAIAHRFVDSVIYEPGEEERIQRLAEERLASADESAETAELSVLSTEDDTELPANLESFMREYKLDPIRSFTREDPEPDSAVVSIGGDELDPEAHLVEGPRLGERRSFPRLVCTVQPPLGWEERGQDDFVAFYESADDADGFRASFNIARVERNSVEPGEFVELVKTEQASQFTDYEFLFESSVEVGGEPAVRIAGRGTHGAIAAMVEQTVVVKDEHVWLVSVFTPVDADEERTESVRSALDAALATLAFADSDDVETSEAPGDNESELGIDDSSPWGEVDSGSDAETEFGAGSDEEMVTEPDSVDFPADDEQPTEDSSPASPESFEIDPVTEDTEAPIGEFGTELEGEVEPAELPEVEFDSETPPEVSGESESLPEVEFDFEGESDAADEDSSVEFDFESESDAADEDSSTELEFEVDGPPEPADSPEVDFDANETESLPEVEIEFDDASESVELPEVEFELEAAEAGSGSAE